MSRDGIAERYERAFSGLSTSRNRSYWTARTKHQAPYKPLLLLSVMDLVERGPVSSGFIEVSPELTELFCLYCERVGILDGDRKMHLPFFHLRGDGFWHLVPRPGGEAALEGASSVGSLAWLEAVVLGARLDDELLELMTDRAGRERLRGVLAGTYFSPEVAREMLEQTRTNAGAFRYGESLLENPGDPAVGERLAEYEGGQLRAVRDQGFRRAVVTAYEHRCALCGIRVRTAAGHTLVNAAHIVPWSLTRDDRPANGLSLCRTCHWTFDEGLVGVTKAYEIVSSRGLFAGATFPATSLGWRGGGSSSPRPRPTSRTRTLLSGTERTSFARTQ